MVLRWSCDGLAMVLRWSCGYTPFREHPVTTARMESAAEYERRRVFCESIKKMTRPEHIELARILRRNGVTMSENQSGLFFDMAKVPGPVFDEMLRFREFVNASSAELAKRDDVLRDLKEAGC